MSADSQPNRQAFQENRRIMPSTMSPALVSIVVSFRNEEKNIPLLVARVTKVFEPLPEDFEIIFVNDVSSDRSLAVLQELHARDSRVKVVNMSRRFGVSECALAGMEHARGAAVIYLDCDLQDPPELIPTLLAQWHAGSKVVHTVRERRLGESALKLFVTRMGYRAIQLGSNIKLPMDCGDYKLLDRVVVDRLLTLRENDPYLRGLVIWIGYQQTFVSYIRDARHEGKSHFPVFSRNPWQALLGGITSFSFTPIYLIGVLSVTVLGASLLLTVVAALGMMFTDTPGYTMALFIGLGLMLWATLLLAIGTVGIYVVRTYKDVRGRPRYIVDNTVGFD
ncbi:glycosyltransferase family 2 protein [Ferrovibrio sp. MS7]|uniref:glycosyltransferase family 2 protein n=1 Tax=Ferrovibrio plantarum TaxID=3119164 RepID=UPI0031373FEF